VIPVQVWIGRPGIRPAHYTLPAVPRIGDLIRTRDVAAARVYEVAWALDVDGSGLTEAHVYAR
jgi:hypothetical protein